ncbi:hypothetical protein U1Q18_029986 [Sarracenia purpurea var. burkii]
MSSALISSSGSWIFTIFNSFVTWAKLFHFGPLDYAKSEITRVICILIIIFGLRRIMFRLMRNIPEGKSIKEHHFFAMVAMFLAVAFVFEYFGYKGYFSAMILGLSVPSGPPLGSGLVEKLEILTVGLLLPVYIVDVGRYIDVFQITWARFKLTVLIIFLAIVGKIAAAMVPSIIGRMPFKDSLALGLVLSSQGFFDVFFFKLNMGYSIPKLQATNNPTIRRRVRAANPRLRLRGGPSFQPHERPQSLPPHPPEPHRRLRSQPRRASRPGPPAAHQSPVSSAEIGDADENRPDHQRVRPIRAAERRDDKAPVLHDGGAVHDDARGRVFSGAGEEHGAAGYAF